MHKLPPSTKVLFTTCRWPSSLQEGPALYIWRLERPSPCYKNGMIFRRKVGANTEGLQSPLKERGKSCSGSWERSAAQRSAAQRSGHKAKMVRAPCCEKMGLKKGPWTPEEDQILVAYIQKFGHGNWRALPKQAGLLRCGKSCRLRWTNYLRPDIKRGNFSREEEETIIQLHEMLGNRWSAIAARLPGRTDNEIKNVWHTHLKKRLKQNTGPANQACCNIQVADDKAKPIRETNLPQILEPSVATKLECNSWIENPVSPQQSSSNFSFSSTESSSIITSENRAITTSGAEDESMDSFGSSNSTEFWPENLSGMDEFWLDTLDEDEDKFIDDGKVPMGATVDPALHVPLSPFPFSTCQDDGMDFWLNLLLAGQTPEL